MKNLFFIALLLAFVSPKHSLAWGKTGHQIVAQIAKENLEPGVLDSVQKYLGAMSFEDAATWMDDVRKDTSLSYMKPWHYVNVEKDKTYVKNNNPNIINELEIVIAALNNRKGTKKEEINFTLKQLFHLVGDLHQPLHVGYGVDKGGNEIKVKHEGKDKNLHWAWDSEIIKSANITHETISKKDRKLSKGKKKKIMQIDVLKWMDESRSYLPQVYKFKNGELDAKYVKKNVKIIEKQLLYGGLRLAAVLNAAFKK
ncbi:MAG: S1/P1 nuclease [Bacteroidota bacterium]|nr:S1/P1 nuclease [Bacteroidota bacterium]